VLGEFEQLILMAVMQVGDGAYGIPIHAELRRRTGRDPSLASVYKTLERLEQKGFVSVRVGPPTPERGGRRKQLYTLTNTGRKELRSALSAIRRMAAGLDVGLEPS
jgi:PadR family transcriptional regulator, regulatory protein PadR